MSDIQQKLENYLNEENDMEYSSENDIELMDRMVNFIMDLDSDNLSEDQIEEALDIIDELAEDNLDDAFDVEEAISAKKVKINPAEKRERRRKYRSQRAALKLRAKKWRRTTKYKQWKRKKERKKSQGKTATGKRIRKFL